MEHRRSSWSYEALLGGLGVLLGLFGGILGPSWGASGGLGVLLGLFWGGLGALLGLSWGPHGSSGAPPGAILEAIDQRMGGGPRFASPLWGHQHRFLGRSWGAFGALLGALGAVLGASLALLGAVFGHLGTILRPPKRIGSEKARRQTSLFFSRRFLTDVGFLGRS